MKKIIIASMLSALCIGGVTLAAAVMAEGAEPETGRAVSLKGDAANKFQISGFLPSIQDTGECGDGVVWSLSADGTELTISYNGTGTGAMTDFDGYMVMAPWEGKQAGITSVVIGDGVTSVGEYAFANCTSLVNVSLPEGLASIGNDAFRACSSLQTIVLPKGMKTIGNYAFGECTSLVNVTIPEGVIIIADGAFFGCSNLRNIDLPASATELGELVFNNCTSLEGIVIPYGCINIKYGTFNGCTGLNWVLIPKTVTGDENNDPYAIGYQAFVDCTNLTDVYYVGSEAEWQALLKNSENDGLDAATYHYEEEVPAVAAGCTATGNIQYWTFDDRRFFFSDVDGRNRITEEETVVPETGHDWDDGVITKAPTCTEEGEKKVTCRHDGNHTKLEPVPATGHDWDEGVVEKEPTCTETGIRRITCRNDGSHVKFEAIPATGKASDFSDYGHDEEHLEVVEESDIYLQQVENGDYLGRIEDKNDPDLPKTGDESGMTTYMILLTASVATVAAASFIYFRNKKYSVK